MLIIDCIIYNGELRLPKDLISKTLENSSGKHDARAAWTWSIQDWVDEWTSEWAQVLSPIRRLINRIQRSRRA